MSSLQVKSNIEPNNEIPRNIMNGFAKILRDQQLIVARQIAEEFDLDYNEVISRCVPSELPTASTSYKKKNKLSVSDFRNSKEKIELKKFTIPQLKSILGEHKLPISGSKSRLINRVWGIIKPSEAPNEPKKRRGRPPKAKQVKQVVKETIESSPEKIEPVEYALDSDKMPSIFIANNTIVDSESSGSQEFKLFANKYIFQEDTDEFNYKGYLEEKQVTFDSKYPAELFKILGLDE